MGGMDWFGLVDLDEWKGSVVAACVHDGETLSSGHYTAVVKVDGRWYIRDDDNSRGY